MRRIIYSLLLCLAIAPLAAAQSQIFIARHAEKAATAADPKDPELSDAGRARAESLARILRDAGLTAVYATEYKRTQQTGIPAAQAAGIDVTTVPADETDALVAQLHNVKGSALVIAHSNTIPAIIKAFGIDTPITVDENDYDNLFVVVEALSHASFAYTIS
ncbi:MAG: histidine phosphatase family protein [Chthoniobacterales bacterium]